jgi:ankyrin repeat protein
MFTTTIWMNCRLRRQVERKLEAISSRASTHTIQPPCTPSDLSKRWRYPSSQQTRSAQAALALASIFIHDYFADTPKKQACYWLEVAANKGSILAQALFVKIATDSPAQTAPLTPDRWLEDAAAHGSITALSLLNCDSSLTAHSQHLEEFRSHFWARCYGVLPEWVNKSISPEGVPTLPGVPSLQKFGAYSNSHLHYAAMIGSIEMIRHLLRNDLSTINSQNSRGETAVLMACRSGHFAAAKYLLDHGADAGILDCSQQNGLHWLSRFDEDKCFEMAWSLLRGGASLETAATIDLEFMDKTAAEYFHRLIPGTPLHRAVAAFNMNAIRALLNLGADPTHEVERQTLICRAASLRRPDILKLLLEYAGPSYDVNKLMPALSGKRTVTVLNRAINGSEAFLLEYIHKSYNDKLLRQTLSTLLAAGAKTMDIPSDPLMRSVRIRESAALETLIEHGHTLDPNKKHDFSPLMTTVFLQDKKSFDILLRNGADVQETIKHGTTSVLSTLHICVKLGDYDTFIAQSLLDHGVDVNHNMDTYCSDSPLLYALTNNDFNTANLLIRNGATLDIQSDTTPRGNVMAELLLYPDSQITFRALEFIVSHPQLSMPFMTNPKSKFTVFHTICKMNELLRRYLRPRYWVATFELLRQKFPDQALLDSQDCSGMTPMHYAVAYAFPEAVQQLLAAGANPLIRAFSDKVTRPDEIVADWMRGMTPVEVFKNGIPEPPGFVSIFREEAAICTARRNKIAESFRPYMN